MTGTVEAVGPFGLVAMDLDGRAAILQVDWPQPGVGDVVQAEAPRVVVFHPSAAYICELLAGWAEAAGVVQVPQNV